MVNIIVSTESLRERNHEAYEVSKSDMVMSSYYRHSELFHLFSVIHNEYRITYNV